MVQFRRNKKANIHGTSLIGTFTVSPKRLVDVFGIPDKSDEYKVSGEYAFTRRGDPKIVFTLYDWKSTSLYDDSYETPVQFWGSNSPYGFHIGGHSRKYLTEFTNWLKDQVA